MTVAEFIEARLGEDEQAATQGGIKGARWDFTGSSCEVRIREPGGDLGGIVARCREGRAVDFSNTIHIARHDPGRVLRQVTAIRAILALADRISPSVTTVIYHGGSVVASPGGGGGVSGGWREQDLLLRQLATIWSDHPDYDEEWRP